MIEVNDKVRLKGSTYQMTVLRPSFDDDTYGHWTCGWICRRSDKWKTATFAPELIEVASKAVPPKLPPPVAVGDVVMLIGGDKTKMVVAEVLEDVAVCFWHDIYGEFHSHRFDFRVISFT